VIGFKTSYYPRKENKFFYFELFGETSPLITPGYTQLMLEENERSKHGTNLAPLYEYYWSLGYVGSDPKWGRDLWWRRHKKKAAEVYLYFPTTGGWWIQELLATVKYLTPGTEHAAVLQNAAQIFASAQPIVEDVSKLAKAGEGLPGAGPIAASSAVLLDIIAKLKITSVPPVKHYKWSVQKVAGYVSEEGKEPVLMHGVKWTIPAKLFIEFGPRLTGSIAVTIIPASEHSEEKPDHIQLMPMPIRAKAVIHWHPEFRGREPKLGSEDGKSEYLKLEITPLQSEGKDLDSERLITIRILNAPPRTNQD